MSALIDVTPSHEEGSSEPRNMIAEVEVLGALFVDPSLFVIVHGDLKASDFYFNAHRLLFESMVRVFSDCETFDPPLIVSDMQKANTYERAGGASLIQRILDRVGSTSNIKHYMREVRECAVRREIAQAGRNIEARALAGDGDTPEKLAANAETDLRCATFRALQSKRTDIKAAFDEVMSIVNDPDDHAPNLLRTGIPTLDAIVGGLPARLVVIGARPKHGKSAFCLQIIRNTLHSGGVVFLASLEMDTVEVVQRMMAAETGVPFDKIRTGKMTEEHRGLVNYRDATVRRMCDGLVVDHTPGRTASYVVANAGRVKDERGRLDLVVVDHFHLLDHQSSGASAQREDIAQSHSSGQLRDAARSLDCPVVVPVQLSRRVEHRSGWDKIPRSSDTRECGGIEQDAYLWVGLMHPQKYGLNTRDTGEPVPDDLFQVRIAENRGGPVGDFPLRFVGKTMTFERW